MKNSLYFILACVLAVLFSINSHAEIYSWTDEKGIKHFSNTSSGQYEIEYRMDESVINEPFDPSMNAVPEAEIQASIEKRKAEAGEKKQKMEQERIAEQKRQLEAERKAKEEKLQKEIDILKRRSRYNRDDARWLRYKLREKNRLMQ